MRLSLSAKSTGYPIPSITSIALFNATENPSEMAEGWIPFSMSSWQAFKRAPAMTTTEVVPSPASISCALDISTNYPIITRFYYHFGGWVDHLHLLQNSSSVVCNQDLALCVLDLHVCKKYENTILSMPLGPKLVRTTSATAIIVKNTNKESR